MYSTDKELLLYSQCHMDIIEVTQKYIIWNPKVTTFKCNSCISLLLSSQLKGYVRAGTIYWCQEHKKGCGQVLVTKFKLARSDILTAVLLIPQVIRNICDLTVNIY
jgi:hypothetical protein